MFLKMNNLPQDQTDIPRNKQRKRKDQISVKSKAQKLFKR